MPMGPSGGIRLAPMPAPRNRRGGTNCAELAQRRVPAALEVDALEIPCAAQDPAALRDPDLVHRAGGRERQVDPRVAQDLQADRGAHAIVAAEAGHALAAARERLVVDRVRGEQPRMAVAEPGKGELQVPALPPHLPE